MHHRRGPWSAHEDAHLLGLVQLHGPHNWVRISQLVTSRSPKQCRERYHQNLKPTLNHDPITPEEGALIERLVGEMGKRWAEIARRLHGRSDNAVKNWWNGGMNRRRRMCLRQRSQSQASEGRSEEPLSPYSTTSHSHSVALTIDVSRKPDDEPLVSPAFSDSSRGRTPSLISDSNSTFSMSPRLSASPITPDNILPPLLGPHGAQRRQSLPILHLSTEPHIPEYTPRTHSFTRRYFSDADRESGQFRSQEVPSTRFESSYEASQRYHYLRHKISSPFEQPRGDNVVIRDPESMQPDNRMNLASILG
ncbi:hypothetical protein RUND412_010156 [Rhizina undulata]